MDDITGAAEVGNYWYGAARKSFKDYPCAVVTNGWKHHHVSSSQALQDFPMAEPAAEKNSLFDPKRSREPLKVASLRSVTHHSKAGQIVPQEGSSPSQSKVAGLPGDQAANENQLQFGAGLRTELLTGTKGIIDAGLWDKKQFFAIRGKLGIRLRRRGYDRCGVAIGRPGKR
jgi:hypothetical protein